MNSMYKVVPSNIENKTEINLSQLPSWENEVKIFIRNAKLLYGIKLLYIAMLIKHADSSVSADSFGKTQSQM